jgi:hypothetical protein
VNAATVVLVTVVVLAVMLLVAPVHVEVVARLPAATDRSPVTTRVRWLFVEWTSDRARKRSRQNDRRVVGRKSGVRASSTDPLGRFRAIAGTPGFKRRLFRLVADVFRVAAPRELSGWFRIGLDDPAATGQALGVWEATRALLPARLAHFVLEPDFSGAVLVGHARALWSVRPGTVARALSRFVFSPVTLRAMYRGARYRTNVRSMNQ